MPEVDSRQDTKQGKFLWSESERSFGTFLKLLSFFQDLPMPKLADVSPGDENNDLGSSLISTPSQE